jgi:hypothetical protein
VAVCKPRLAHGDVSVDQFHDVRVRQRHKTNDERRCSDERGHITLQAEKRHEGRRNPDEGGRRTLQADLSTYIPEIGGRMIVR